MPCPISRNLLSSLLALRGLHFNIAIILKYKVSTSKLIFCYLFANSLTFKLPRYCDVDGYFCAPSHPVLYLPFCHFLPLVLQPQLFRVCIICIPSPPHIPQHISVIAPVRLFIHSIMENYILLNLRYHQLLDVLIIIEPLICILLKEKNITANETEISSYHIHCNSTRRKFKI